MQKVNFFGYAVPTQGFAGAGIGNVDHTFVLPSSAVTITKPSDAICDWGCYGRGLEALQEGARVISQGSALAEWGR